MSYRQQPLTSPWGQRFRPPYFAPPPTAIVLLKLLLGTAALLTLALWVALAPLFHLLLGMGGVMAGLILIRWPWLIWPALGALLPFSSAQKIGPLSLTELILVVAVVLWFADGVRRRTLRVTPSAPLIALLCFIASTYLSLLQAQNLGEAGAELFKWVEFALILALVPGMVGPKGAPWLVAGLLIGGMAQSVLGLYQFIFQIGPEWFIIMERFMRASGTFSQPNPYGGYLGLVLPVAASLALWGISRAWGSGRASGLTQLLWTLFYGGSTLLIGAGLLASWSRGGWLGAVGAVAIILTIRNRRTAITGGIVTLILTLALLLGAVEPGWIPAPLAARFQEIPTYLGLTDVLQQPITDENFAIVERVAHWVAAWRMWERAPWLGVGPGNYAEIYPTVRLPRWAEPLGHAHNIYLNLLAEGGIVGLGSYLLLWLIMLGWLWRQHHYQIRHSAWTNALRIGVIGMVGYLSIHNFFDNLFVQGIYLQIALWLAAVQSNRTETQASRQLN